MSTPIWILITLSAAIGSAVLAYFLARRGAPTKQQIEALNTELEAARSEAQQVEGKVTEHFERSAMLFGQLAKDYKAFLDHYSVSAQALGLSERRARELLEQGYQPLLTHLEADPAAEPGAEAGTEALAETVAATEDLTGEAGVEKADTTKPAAAERAATKRDSRKADTEPPRIEDVVEAGSVHDPDKNDLPEADVAKDRSKRGSGEQVKVVGVDLDASLLDASLNEGAASEKSTGLDASGDTRRAGGRS